MFGIQEDYENKLATAGEIASRVQSNDVIYLNAGSGFPITFSDALTRRASELRNVRIAHAVRPDPTMLEIDYLCPEYADSFTLICEYSFDRVAREAVTSGRGSYRPHYPSQSGMSWPYEIDYLVTSASPMDEHGYFSFGAAACYPPDFLPQTRRLVLEVNPHQPRVYGDSFVHISQVDALYEVDEPIPSIDVTSGAKPTEVEEAIGAHVAELIEDRSTLQLGIGAVPDVVARLLRDKKDLGIHTEMLSDPLVMLVECGAVTNRFKTFHPGRIVCTCCFGSEKLYRYIADNPAVETYPISYTNNPENIARNYKQVSINATLQVDFMGQCASESLGTRHYSGIGGQWEFTRGAYLSPGGKGFICVRSTAKNGTISTITPTLSPGAAVSITRNDVHYVVTEYGAALLKGRTIEERTKSLISIAHPDFRDELTFEAKRLCYLT